MSPVDSSDSSDAEAPPEEDPLSSNHAPFKSNHPQTSAFNHHTTSTDSTTTTKTSNNSTVSSSSSSSTTKSQPSTPVSQPSVLSPLLYQTPQGMMYATPSNGGVIFSLAPQSADGGNTVHPPQFITIPLSVVAANGQGELDLSKRK